MNQKKITQEKTKFSKLRLRSSSNNKSNKFCSPHPKEKISSYFLSVLNETEIIPNSEDTSEDAPETTITKLRSTNEKTNSQLSSDIDIHDDTNDFTKPKIINATSKLENKSNHFENVTKRKKQSTSSKVHYLNGDTNEEHLQLAVAMSKSILDLENPQITESEESPFPSTQQKITKVKQTLDQFGFKSGKCSLQNNLKTNSKLTRGKKIKYFTPTLFLRTEEDRTKLIENKVSQIINNISTYNNAIKENNVYINNDVDNKPRSFILRDYYKEETILFNKNALCLPNAPDNIFYNGLVRPSNVEVGVLLKDWLTIPGRESTPPLEDNNIENESVLINNLQVPPITTIETSMSPELFTDDDVDDDDNMKPNETITNYKNKQNQISESDCSTKSISILDNIYKNTSITENIELSSLSPFPEIANNTKTKEIASKLKENNNVNSDSLSPFEPLDIEIITRNSPKRKVTPTKKTPSPKKYVITPKGRRIITSEAKNRHSPCKRSILFTDNQDKNDNSDKNSDICIFESFSNDSLECFDLTHSSDDELLNLDNASKNANKSFTVTQLLNELSPTKCKVINGTKDVHPSFDSQASIETVKLNISKSLNTDGIEEEFSPEFDCLNTSISNNKVFYETLNNSRLYNIDDDDDMIPLEHLNNSVTKDIIQENREHKITSTPTTTSTNQNIEENALKTPLLNDEIIHSFCSPKSKVKDKRNNLLMRRSFSENFIDNKVIENQSTQLLSTSNKTLSRSVDEIEKDDLSNDNIFLSRSSISTCSDISDEELNYSCNSIYKRYDLSDVIAISDEADDESTSASTKCNSDILESSNDLWSRNKSLKHPRVLKLSTPIKVMKSNHSFCGENVIHETSTTNSVVTPLKSDIIIKKDHITPKGDYSDMDTPERNRELEKFGLKPMKRNKGVKILHYIYDSTHPYVNDSIDGKLLNSSSDDENRKATKRRKTKKSNDEISSIYAGRNNNIIESFNGIEQRENQIAESEQIEDMIFERKQSAKISSCRLPLHVAWYNLLINSRELQEAILTYKPVQVEEIYDHFKKLGYKFHIQDIISFLDKKCITIRIGQNNRRK